MEAGNVTGVTACYLLKALAAGLGTGHTHSVSFVSTCKASVLTQSSILR